jgi:hypothetical protein
MKKKTDLIQLFLIIMVLFFMAMLGIVAIDISQDIKAIGDILSD